MEFNSTEDFLKNKSFLNYCLQINQEDISFWEDYVVKNPEKKQYIVEASELIKDTKLLLMAEKLKPQAISSLKEYLKKSKKKQTFYLWRYVATAAAVLLVLLTTTIFFYRQQKNVPKPSLANFSTHEYYYEAGPNARKAVDLWDGSFVILDKGAKLSIDPNFGKTERGMQLSGVAYFKVAKDKVHPFKVYTGNYVTTAVGTAFRLQANNSQKKLKVELEEGKVTVARKKGSIWNLVATLNPKESISFGDRLNLPVNEKFSDKNFNRWKIQEVIFKDAPLKEVLLQLEIYYNVSIKVDDTQLTKETFNGTFRHDSLKSVMDVLCFSINKRYTFNDPSHITIY